MGKDETAKEDENTEKSQKFGINLFLLIGCIVLLVIVIFLLSIHLSSPSGDGDASFFSYTKADLGTLGDLLGGALNPILSFATICLLVWSIQIQISELKETRKEMARSSDALEKTQEAHEKNLQSQERTILIPIAQPKFDELIQAVYSLFAQKITIRYESNKRLIGQAGLGPSEIQGPSCKDIAKDINNGRSINDILLKREEPKQSDNAIPNLMHRIEILSNHLHEILGLVKALKRIKADDFLYFDDYIQARLICKALAKITEHIKSDSPLHSGLTELAKTYEKMFKVRLSEIEPVSSVSKKPFNVVVIRERKRIRITQTQTKPN